MSVRTSITTRQTSANAVSSLLPTDSAIHSRPLFFTPSVISELSRDELIRLIGAVQIGLPQPQVVDRLRHCDRRTLEQLAHLALRFCRNQGY
jgi:hypothetical protein